MARQANRRPDGMIEYILDALCQIRANAVQWATEYSSDAHTNEFRYYGTDTHFSRRSSNGSRVSDRSATSKEVASQEGRKSPTGSVPPRRISAIAASDHVLERHPRRRLLQASLKN